MEDSCSLLVAKDAEVTVLKLRIPSYYKPVVDQKSAFRVPTTARNFVFPVFFNSILTNPLPTENGMSYKVCKPDVYS